MRTRTLIPLILLAPGAVAQVPTEIKVEIDWMAVPQGHSHKPSQAVLDAVVDMFACEGIQLTLLLSNEITEIPSMHCPDPFDPDQEFFDCAGPVSFSQLKAANKTSNSSWHYCIFAHQTNLAGVVDTSGVAEIGRDDLVVSLGAFLPEYGTEFERASTFAHELGHNLGLRHYSPSTPVIGRGPHAPNYASVMSYQYQMRGIKTQMECKGLVDSDHLLKDLDYSHGRFPGLPELFLDEEVGAGIHVVDWDCSGAIESDDKTYNIDVDQDWCQNPGGIGVVYDRNDWADIVDFTDLGPMPFTPADYEICVTADAGAQYLGDPSNCNVEPTLSVEPCVTSGWMVWVDPSASGVGGGTGDNPYRNIDIGYFFSPGGSILYLQPGTHTSTTGPLVFDHELVLAGPGGAVVDP